MVGIAIPSSRAAARLIGRLSTRRWWPGKRSAGGCGGRPAGPRPPARHPRPSPALPAADPSRPAGWPPTGPDRCSRSHPQGTTRGLLRGEQPGRHPSFGRVWPAAPPHLLRTARCWVYRAARPPRPVKAATTAASPADSCSLGCLLFGSIAIHEPTSVQSTATTTKAQNLGNRRGSGFGVCISLNFSYHLAKSRTSMPLSCSPPIEFWDRSW